MLEQNRPNELHIGAALLQGNVLYESRYASCGVQSYNTDRESFRPYIFTLHSADDLQHDECIQSP